ncbi:MAG: GTPase Era [Candidatus Cloacimonadota bacterium]|nr:MAG: GTPase Era [Candidatus Cloacimonadota bacterium]
MNINFRCGFVSITGRPNVGKSTLMNSFLGEKLSIISPKPQTTRQSVKGILSDENKQIIFLDTPGYVKPRYELHEKMLYYIRESLLDTDLILFITDVRTFPTDYDNEVLKIIDKIKIPKFALLNKIDLVEDDFLKEQTDKISENSQFDKIIPISAKHKTNLLELEEAVTSFMPLNPPYYNPDELSDLPMRFFVQEIIREKIFLNYSDEIPYSSTAVVESYKDFPNKSIIHANIWIERKSQKPILIGKNGSMIKKIRLEAEKEIHGMTGKRVKLELWVKIKNDWRKKKNALKEFGYK